ncbi:MAG: DUF3516 domain-containing protein [Propionibacteriaceae bacterium]|nr:DUF3516 domain-containing protein [Propionibacteriaceae bacterium]
MEMLTNRLPRGPYDPDALYEAFTGWARDGGLELYPHQAEALIDTLAGANTVITTPTGSGKSLIAVAAHFAALADQRRSYYTAPIKALVSEKFFALTDVFGADLVGMVTGDAAVNPDAPIVCCTAEILANLALREGRAADVGLVIMDEFHFIADPDRGWAWQVTLSELPQAQFVIMSATLGDVTGLRRDLAAWTSRETTVIADAVRPVPLTYAWAVTPLHDTIAGLVWAGQAPVYIVHPSQAAAAERAQALLSVPLVDKERRRAIVETIGDFRFAPGFGPTLRKLLHAGIAVHHAGMLPKYRRLVETLAQSGLLVAICGTDTLGVGINVPIRTVLFTTLVKYDGRRERLVRAREFHQIAGRAGRPGFDTIGYVVVQAPDHEVESARLKEKFADDPKKLKSVRVKKPEGTVNYGEASFRKLVDAQPEALTPRLKITHAMLLNLLRRDEDTRTAMAHIIDCATRDETRREKLLTRAGTLFASLAEAGIIGPRDSPTAGGRTFDLAPGLQEDFALNQALSAFALDVLDHLDPTTCEAYTPAVLSVIESTLEDPLPVLLAQQHRARGEAVAEMKADGLTFEERQAELDEITWPKPLAELLDIAYTRFAQTHPWILDHPVSPKSVVREMAERAMTFAEYVAFHKVQRSEGTLLRYLSDAWRALRQTVPEPMRDAEFDDLVAWLGAVVRMTDSSLVDEWETLTAGLDGGSTAPLTRVTLHDHPMTGNERAFTVLIRNALFRRVQLAAADDVDGLAELDDAGWTGDDWDEALGRYWADHAEIGTDADARGPALLAIDRSVTPWQVRQVIADPEHDHDWAITAEVDPVASDREQRLALTVTGFGRLDGV